MFLDYKWKCVMVKGRDQPPVFPYRMQSCANKQRLLHKLTLTLPNMISDSVMLASPKPNKRRADHWF